MTSLSWESVLAWRLERQHLAARAPRDDALAVVSDIAGRTRRWPHVPS